MLQTSAIMPSYILLVLRAEGRLGRVFAVHTLRVAAQPARAGAANGQQHKQELPLEASSTSRSCHLRALHHCEGKGEGTYVFQNTCACTEFCKYTCEIM